MYPCITLLRTNRKQTHRQYDDCITLLCKINKYLENAKACLCQYVYKLIERVSKINIICLLLKHIVNKLRHGNYIIISKSTPRGTL